MRCLLLFVVVCLVACERHDPQAAQPQAYAYPATAPLCRTKPAPAPAGLPLLTIDGLEILIRLPTNYRPEIAHRLLVVYAAAGMRPAATERFTGYTPLATAMGYIVAYSQPLRPSRSAMRKLAQVPVLLGDRFCVDQLFVTGHSDGGTAATAITVVPELASKLKVAGVAPSAAGFTGEDLHAIGCPTPRPVIVWHAAKDRLFPGWGREASRWWAQCNHCNLQRPPERVGECIAYPGCAAPVHYCESPGGHTVWPSAAAFHTLNFFNTSTQIK